MSKADDTFIREFGLILGLLFVFTIAMIVLARSIGEPAMAQVRNSNTAVAARTAKVGTVRMEGDPVPAAEVAAAAPAPATEAMATSGTRGGEDVYNLACAMCHTTGAAGAPKVDDSEAWGARAEQGVDTLVDHAINGFKLMPARGGNPSLADDEVRGAVTFMLEKAGIDVSDASSTVPAAAARVAAAAAEMVIPSASAAESDSTEPVQVAAAGDGKPGAEVYQSACFACHMTGAANAPKVGDAKAWQSRMNSGGIDQLVNNALNGKNAMPAKGGVPSLEEADIRNAVVYMLEESGVASP